MVNLSGLRAGLAAAALGLGVVMSGHVQAATTYYQASAGKTCGSVATCSVPFKKLTGPILVNNVTCNFYFYETTQTTQDIQITEFDLTDGSTKYYLGPVAAIAYGVPDPGNSNVTFNQYQSLSAIQFVISAGKTPTIELDLTKQSNGIAINCVLSGVDLS